MGKATIKSAKSVKRVMAANKQAMRSSVGTIERPKPGAEIFGASNRRVEPTTRLLKGGAVSGRVPERGSK